MKAATSAPQAVQQQMAAWERWGLHSPLLKLSRGCCSCRPIHGTPPLPWALQPLPASSHLLAQCLPAVSCLLPQRLPAASCPLRPSRQPTGPPQALGSLGNPWQRRSSISPAAPSLATQSLAAPTQAQQQPCSTVTGSTITGSPAAPSCQFPAPCPPSSRAPPSRTNPRAGAAFPPNPLPTRSPAGRPPTPTRSPSGKPAALAPCPPTPSSPKPAAGAQTSPVWTSACGPRPPPTNLAAPTPSLPTLVPMRNHPPAYYSTATTLQLLQPSTPQPMPPHAAVPCIRAPPQGF
mmetsp:Transcript_23576/g.61307  ORF Transcript_23576/g.61307 Transcript_23576/m.61307 type:complete len:291 (-) Transcript_23576:3635-4507(-)